MKQLRFVLLPLFAAILFLATSCGDDDDTSDNDAATTDTTTASSPATTDTVATSGPINILLTRHKVANFAKWKEGYDRGDSMRLANGLHNFIIGRGVPDSNTVLVAVKADDVEKAKAFAKGADLRNAMKRSGVIGTPTIMVLNVPFLSTEQTSDLRRLTTMTVKDWDAWRTSFESRKQMRLENGISDRSFGHDVDDNKKVVLVTNILDSAKAAAYVKSDQMKQNLSASGVVGQPTRFTYRVVQSY